MLIERNENLRKEKKSVLKRTKSGKKIQKVFKENLVYFNTKELLTKPTNILNSEPPLISKNLKIEETNKIKTYFLKNIMNNELGKSSNSLISDYIKTHILSTEIRARMVFL